MVLVRTDLPVVEMSDTVSSKHAVMFPLEDTLTTGGAVPGPRGSDGLTDSTVVPVFPAGRLQ